MKPQRASKNGAMARHRSLVSLSLLSVLLTVPLFSSPAHAIPRLLQGGGPTSSLDQEILAARLRVYNQVVQALVMQTARGIPQGQVTPVPQLPFSGNKSISEVVIVDVHTVQLNGFTFREFYLPPGVDIPTTEPQVILAYQQYAASNAPVHAPDGYVIQSPLVTLTAYPISALSNALAQPLLIAAPAGNPITVTFPAAPGTNLRGSTCATFSGAGTILLITTNPGAAATVCDGTVIGTFTLTTVPAPPPGIQPAPGPAPSGVLPPGVAPVAPPPATGPVANLPPGTVLPPGAPLPPGVRQPPAGVAQPPPPPESSSNLGLILGLTLGLGLPLLILLALGLWYAFRAHSRRQLEKMEKESDKRASLETAIVGGSRAPAAGALRTRPYLESEELTADRI